MERVEIETPAKQADGATFSEIVRRFRSATDPEEVARLGDLVGGMIFGAETTSQPQTGEPLSD